MTGFELKTNARKLIRENAPKIFVVSLIYVVLATVMSELLFRLLLVTDSFALYLDNLLTGERANLGTIFNYIRIPGVPFAAALWMLSAVLDTGVKSYCLNISRGKPGDGKNLFDGFLFLGKVLLLRITTSVMLLLWSLLLIVPAIPASYRYRQAYYILLDDPKKGVLACIRESKRLMHRRKLDLFLVDLSFIGWIVLDSLINILSPLPFSLPIVSVLLTPYHGLACAAFYDRLIFDLAA